MRKSKDKNMLNRAGRHSSSVRVAESANVHVENVQSAIDKLAEDLNAYEGFKTASDKLKGNVAEVWHAGTYNINAALNESSNSAEVPKSNQLGSADTVQSDGAESSLKWCRSAEESARQQAKTFGMRYEEYCANGGEDSYEEWLLKRGFPDDTNPAKALYSGQVRIIPTEQLERAKEFLKEQIDKALVEGRTEDMVRYQETLEQLSAVLSDAEGNQSIELSTDTAVRIAEDVKEGEFSPKDFGLTTEDLFTSEILLEKAWSAASSAALITLILKVAPEIVATIRQLIEDGDIDEERFKKIGFAALTGSAEGALNGSVSSVLTYACKIGKLGLSAKEFNPSVIAAITVITLHTMSDAFEVAMGRKTQQMMVERLLRETFTSSCAMLGGAVGASLTMALPVLGYFLGSFVGSLLGSFAYSTGYNKAISFCIESGWTMFGLVEQDYTLPEEALKNLGIEVFDYEKFELETFEFSQFKPMVFQMECFIPPQIEFTFLRRGVIATNRVGYC